MDEETADDEGESEEDVCIDCSYGVHSIDEIASLASGGRFMFDFSMSTRRLPHGSLPRNFVYSFTRQSTLLFDCRRRLEFLLSFLTHNERVRNVDFVQTSPRFLFIFLLNIHRIREDEKFPRVLSFFLSLCVQSVVKNSTQQQREQQLQREEESKH